VLCSALDWATSGISHVRNSLSNMRRVQGQEKFRKGLPAMRKQSSNFDVGATRY
jgi:hypothetical protein